MPGFGENLRRERELRGIAIPAMVAATKISGRMIDAIETERFERLPGGVFDRSFVRQYARYVGLDEERVLAEFDETFRAAGRAKDKAQEARLERMYIPDPDNSSSRVPLIATIAVLALAAVGAGGWRYFGGGAESKNSPAQEIAHPPIVAPPAAPVIQPSVSEPKLPTEIELLTEAVQACWLQVKVDGTVEFQGDLRKGDSRTFRSSGTIDLKVGNASALRVTMNGEVLPPLGARGEVKTATFTLDDAIARARAKDSGGAAAAAGGSGTPASPGVTSLPAVKQQP